MKRTAKAYALIQRAIAMIDKDLKTGKDKDGKPVIDSFEWSNEQDECRGFQSNLESILHSYEHLSDSK